MIDDTCRFIGDRDATLVAYLYDEIDPAERGIFEVHLASCARCRTDLSALGGVRAALARWAPPEPSFAGASVATLAPVTVTPRTPTQVPPVVTSEVRAHRALWKELGDIPAWAQVAAAMLFMGVAAGMANLEVRYDAQGVTVRTGWSKSAAVGSLSGGQASRATAGDAIAQAGNTGAAPPWRADLVALEKQLRQELRPGLSTSGPGTPASPGGNTGNIRTQAADAELMRRVRALVDESEKRQQRELALRVAEVVRDVSDQRRADLRRIDLSLNGVQNSLGVEVLKQRQSLNYLLQVSQRP